MRNYHTRYIAFYSCIIGRKVNAWKLRQLRLHINHIPTNRIKTPFRGNRTKNKIHHPGNWPPNARTAQKRPFRQMVYRTLTILPMVIPPFPYVDKNRLQPSRVWKYTISHRRDSPHRLGHIHFSRPGGFFPIYTSISGGVPHLVQVLFPASVRPILLNLQISASLYRNPFKT